jgi:hypothetical protein
MSSKYYKSKKGEIQYVKKSPFNTRKRTMIISPDEGILPIEDYGKGKNFPGKIIRVLNAKGGRVRDKMPKRNKKNFRPTEKGAGMTRAGVAAYRRANPGSKLKTADTMMKKGGKIPPQLKKFIMAKKKKAKMKKKK